MDSDRKFVKIDAGIHARLTAAARRNFRSIQRQADCYLDRGLRDDRVRHAARDALDAPRRAT